MHTARRSVLVAVALLLALLPQQALAAGAPDSSAATPPHDGRHVLVGFAPGSAPGARADAHAAERGRVVNRFDAYDLDVVELPRGADPVAAAARYQRNPNVAYAHPNWEVRLLSAPNDTLFRDQWGFDNTGQAVTGSTVKGVADADIDAPEGWDIAFGPGLLEATGGTRVGVIDTGIDRSHADLLNKTKVCASAVTGIGLVTEGTCSDDNLHGTHVAGTIGALTGNGLGVAGTAPNAELAVFKALNGAGTGFYADIVAGVDYLRTRSKVISMSIGGPKDASLDAALARAYAGNVLLVAAAGNDGDATLNYPAAHPDVVSVAAIDAAGARARFSNCNADVEIAAPGVDVWSTGPGNGYLSLSGTSMATPHVAGVAAMIISEKGLSAAGTRSLLKSSAVGSGGCGNVGVVNLAAALGGGTTTPPPTDPVPAGAIGGRVTDAATKAAISGANVSCGTAGSARTGTDGAYAISNVAPATYTCTASATGYRSKSQSVAVASGVTTTASFALRKR